MNMEGQQTTGSPEATPSPDVELVGGIPHIKRQVEWRSNDGRTMVTEELVPMEPVNGSLVDFGNDSEDPAA